MIVSDIFRRVGVASGVLRRGVSVGMPFGNALRAHITRRARPAPEQLRLIQQGTSGGGAGDAVRDIDTVSCLCIHGHLAPEGRQLRLAAGEALLLSGVRWALHFLLEAVDDDHPCGDITQQLIQVLAMLAVRVRALPALPVGFYKLGPPLAQQPVQLPDPLPGRTHKDVWMVLKRFVPHNHGIRLAHLESS